MKRKNDKRDKMKLLTKSAMTATPHTALTDRLGSTENKIRKEIAIMKKCRHAHVVRLLEVIDDKLTQKIYLSKHMLLARCQVMSIFPSQQYLCNV